MVKDNDSSHLHLDSQVQFDIEEKIYDKIDGLSSREKTDIKLVKDVQRFLLKIGKIMEEQLGNSKLEWEVSNKPRRTLGILKDGEQLFVHCPYLSWSWNLAAQESESVPYWIKVSEIGINQVKDINGALMSISGAGDILEIKIK